MLKPHCYTTFMEYYANIHSTHTKHRPWLVDVVCLWQRKKESERMTERASDRISLCFRWQSMSRECSVYKSWRMPCCYHSDCCYSLKQNPSGSALFPTHTDAHLHLYWCLAVRAHIWYRSMEPNVLPLFFLFGVSASRYFCHRQHTAQHSTAQPFNLLYSLVFSHTEHFHVSANFPPVVTCTAMITSRLNSISCCCCLFLFVFHFIFGGQTKRLYTEHFQP